MVARHRTHLKPWLVSSVVLVATVLIFGYAIHGEEVSPAQAAPEDTSEGTVADNTIDCQHLAAMIRQQKSFISSETGQLKREIAALRDDVSKPGLKEIFAGMGYIFGLMGMGLYLHGRKERVGQAGGKSF